MNSPANQQQKPEPAARQRNLARALVGFLLYIFLVPAMLFIAAGTVRWPMAWVYTTLLLLATFGSRIVTWFKNPDLLRERAQFTSAAGTKAEDRWLATLVGIVGPTLMSLVAGLDHRWEWSPILPTAVSIVGAAIVAVAYGMAVWAMVVNQYFSAVVRIQKDRGQTVVSGGPYALVRHPAYAASLWAALAFPLMLNALWALLPGLGLILVTVLRTRLEDAKPNCYADMPNSPQDW